MGVYAILSPHTPIKMSMHFNASRSPFIRRPATTRKLPVWKRAVDIACCLAVLPFLALGSLVVWLLTLLFSPGPIFFKQERVGYRGRRFMIFKFRTMHLAAETASHSAHLKELIRSGAPMQKLDGRGHLRRGDLQFLGDALADRFHLYPTQKSSGRKVVGAGAGRVKAACGRILWRRIAPK